MKKRILLVVILILLAGVAWWNLRKVGFFENNPPQNTLPTQSVNKPKMTIASSAFTDNTNIPSMYTCDGEGINPPLLIDQVPANVLSLALVVRDPDAPEGVFIHWILYQIDPKSREIAGGIIPINSKVGLNSAGKVGFIGPCPPSGTHRYIFTLYALDSDLNLPTGLSIDKFEKAISGHVLDQTQLTGLYQKQS